MATRYELSWKPAENRWRKRYRGRYYYFPLLPGETKKSSYRRVLREWRKLKDEIDQAPSEDSRQWQILIDRAKEELEELRQHDTPENRIQWEFVYYLMQQYELYRDRGAPYFFDGDPSEIRLPLIVLGSMGEPPPWHGVELDSKPKTDDLQTAIDKFLRDKERESRVGAISIDRVERLARHLRVFAEMVTTDDIRALSSQHLLDFREALLERADKGSISHRGAKDCLADVRQFVQYLWQREWIAQLPRCLNEKGFVPPTPKKAEAVVFTTAEVHRLIMESHGMTRLFVLLAANCAMTQADIADLRHDEVDWKKGTITRQRTKTRDKGAVPTVTYKLWEPTFALLKQHRSDHPQLVLTNRNGTPLLRKQYTKKRTIQKIDNITSAYKRLRSKTGIAKPLKTFRATGASWLAGHPDYSQLVPLYLGHAPTTVADRHYVRAPQGLFDEAITWLEEQLLPSELKSQHG